MKLTKKQMNIFNKVSKINEICFSTDEIEKSDQERIIRILKYVFNLSNPIDDNKIINSHNNISTLLTNIAVSLKDADIKINNEFVIYLKSTYDKWDKLFQLIEKYWDKIFGIQYDFDSVEYPGLISTKE